jgi:hypothetical protein
MYYGNSTMGSRENPEGVWDGNYKGVWHLDESGTGTRFDTTSNGNDGTPSNYDGDEKATGLIGLADNFDEINDIIIVNDFDYGPEFSISFWFNTPDLIGNSYQYMFSHASHNINQSLNVFFGEQSAGSNPNGITVAFRDINDPSIPGAGIYLPTGFADGEWHLFSLTTESGFGSRFYLDGDLISSDTRGGDFFNPNSNIYFGGRSDNNSLRFFGGLLDEIHVSNIMISTGWIATEYNNQYDPHSFFTVGPEETIDNSPPTYSNLIESSDPLELGETEVITLDVSDPSGINQVKIEYLGTNHSMTNIGGDTWQYDSWTPSSVGNYSYTIWMKDTCNNWNSTAGTIEVIDTTPPNYSDLIESADPLQLGQNETITIKVYDSPGSGVNQVLLEYELSNHTMGFIGGNTWSWSKWKPTSPIIYPYTIYMQDMENNWNMTSGTITVVETSAPIIENVTKSEDPLELGNIITISADIFDEETNVSIVFIELNDVNYTMDFVEGYTYEYNWTRSWVGTVLYVIYANDSLDNWNSFSGSFDIVDTTPPAFSDLEKSEDPLELGNTVIISVNCTDLAGINEVRIEFEASNDLMKNLGGNKWQYNWTPSNVGNNSYTIWAKDNNNNWNFINNSILVQDTTPPIYSDLTESADPVELGESLIISINATDLTDIKDVRIEFQGSNHTMTYIGGDIWRYNSWMPGSIGNYTYTIYITDNNDNLNYVSNSILFQDTIIPFYSNLFENADPLELGDNLIIRIDIEDFAGINQSLVEFEGANHTMTNIYGDTWQYDSWIPNNWIFYQYKIHMEDKSGNWNSLTNNITVQDTTPPPSPILTNSPSGDVSGILVFDWSDGVDPSGISFYILIIDNETNPLATPGYVYIFNITNEGPESSYCELPEILPPGTYHFFLAQVDGVGQQGDYTRGTFTVITVENGTPGNNTFLIIVIIVASVIGSVTAIVLVRRKLKKDIAPPREKISLKIISSHINKLSSAQFTLKAEEIESITNEKEIEIRLSEIKDMGEELFSEGAYLEAQKQFMLGRDLLIDLGREEEAKLFSELISGIEGLIEEREKRLEVLEQVKIKGNSVEIFELYHEIIAISKKLRDPDTASFYQSELINHFQNNLNFVDLENYRYELNQKAGSLIENNIFEIAAQLYKKCENISQLFVELGREEEIVYIEEFRSKKEECLKKI